ncbi:MAG: protein-disulfide reductase DsbD [Cardiobacteriaceae bacterium]|nr:protein-disulfide reductase DsbD [Cardiobacteriaceae bacterium]
MQRFLLFILTILTAHAYAESDPLPAEDVFKPEIHQIADGNGYQTEVTIKFPEGYYLYADKTTLSGAQGEESRTPAEEKDDPYLGPTRVWHHAPTITLKHQDAADSFTLKAQGCQENVVCYPPTTWTLHVEKATPAMTEASQVTANNEATPTKEEAAPELFQNSNEDILEPEEAFVVNATPKDGKLLVSYRMPDGYYLYKRSLKAELDGAPFALSLPEGELHQDEFLGEQQIYRHELRFEQEQPAQGGALTLHLQGCAEGRICYPPMTRTFTVPATDSGKMPAASAVNDNNSHTNEMKHEQAQATPVAASPVENKPLNTNEHNNSAQPSSDKAESSIVQRLNDNFLIALPFVLLLGIGVSFTACIYPLVPIVTSLVVGKNTSSGRAYRLISVYVLAMGLAMGLLGAVFGIFQINLQVILQKTWIVILVALLFAGLSLSLFDVYTLQTPRWLQKPVDKLNRKQQSGSYLGAAAMGALSILVVSPCATPILTALLLFTTQTTPLKGATALFFFGLGTGLPLLLFAGAFRKFMPKAGTWMDNVKKGFAFALLAIATYLITRIMPLAWAFAVWSVYALLFACYVYGDRKIRRFFAGIAFIIALALGVQSANQLFASPAETHMAASHNGISFRELHNVDEIEAALMASDKPVFLDFYADWCVACKKWEKHVWHNPRFVNDLADYTLLKIDVTDFNDAHKAIFNSLNLVGPPAVLRYAPHSSLKQAQEKIIGELDSDAFAAKLAEWQKK